MKDEVKPQEQLNEENKVLRARIDELEKLETERKRAQNIISGLYDISKVVSSEANLDELYKAIHNHLGTIVDTTNFFIALFDKKSDLISFPYFVDEMDKEIVISSASKSKSLSSEVIRTGKPLFIRKKEFEKRLAKEELKLWGTLPEIWLGVPLKIKNEKIGVLSMQSYTDPNTYSEEDIALLESISDQIAIAINHKRTEEELKKSEEKWRSVVENVPYIIMTVDHDGTIQFINHTVSGLNADEVTGSKLFEYIPPEYHDLQKKSLKQVFKTGQSISYQLKSIGTDSSTAWYESRLGPIRHDGQIVAATLITTDITKRKAAEEELEKHQKNLEELVKERTEELTKINEQLQREITERMRTEEACRESEEKFRNLAEESPNMIFIYQKGRLIYVNEMCENILGCKKDELYSPDFDFYTFIAPEHLDLVKTNFKKFLNGETIPPYDLSLITKDNKRIEAILAIISIKYEGEDAILGVATDITDRKHAELALRESEEKFRGLAEQSPNMIFINRMGKVVYVNEQCEKMTGYTKEEFYSPDFNFFILIAPETKKTVEVVHKKHLKGEDIPPYEYTLITKDGKHLNVINSTKLINYGGKQAILGIVTDITDRKRVEISLRESEEKYRNLVERANDGIAIIQDSIVKYVNPALVNMMGYSTNEVIGTNFSSFITPGELPKVEDRYKRRMKGEDVPSVYETAFIHKDGRRIDIELNAGVIPYEGKPADFVLVRDIMERKQTEEKLRESEERFRLLFENISDVVFVFNSDLVLTNITPTVEAMSGYKPEELIGSSIGDLDFLTPESMKQAFSIAERIFAGENLGYKEYEFIAKDGTKKSVEVNYTSIFHEDDLAEIVSVARDITERKEAEEKLRESEEMYRSLVKTLPDAVTMTDLEGNINYVSPRTLELHGFNNENELLGKSAFELIDPSEHEIAMKNLKKTLDDGFARNLEYTLKNKDGSTFTGLLNTALIKDAHGEPKSFIATMRDISERKQTEEQIKKSLDEKEVLLREIHHRVKNNIQVISSMLHLYSAYIKDEPYLEAFHDIQNRIKSMALIHEKLYQTKDMAQVDFNEYIKDLVNSLFRFYGININKIKPKIEVKGISLGLDAGIPCGLIINELVSNSLKHGFGQDMEGMIHIKMKPENKNAVALIVSDNGKGFPQDFDFKNTKTFGLQLVITLVEQLGGNIELNNKGGTEFKITFEKGKEKEGMEGYA